MAERRGRRIAMHDFVIGAALIALSLVLWREALGISRVVTYGIGPAVSLKVVGSGLAALGVATIVATLLGKGGPPALEFSVRPVIILLLGCAGMIACIRFGGGFIAATTIIFAATAYAFGERSILKNIVIGLILALVIFFTFTKGLTLGLPRGPLEAMLGG